MENFIENEVVENINVEETPVDVAEVCDLESVEGDAKSKLKTLAIAGAVTGGAVVAWHFAKPVIGKGVKAVGNALSKLGTKLESKKAETGSAAEDVIDTEVSEEEFEE